MKPEHKHSQITLVSPPTESPTGLSMENPPDSSDCDSWTCPCQHEPRGTVGKSRHDIGSPQERFLACIYHRSWTGEQLPLMKKLRFI